MANDVPRDSLDGENIRVERQDVECGVLDSDAVEDEDEDKELGEALALDICAKLCSATRIPDSIHIRQCPRYID